MSPQLVTSNRTISQRTFHRRPQLLCAKETVDHTVQMDRPVVGAALSDDRMAAVMDMAAMVLLPQQHQTALRNDGDRGHGMDLMAGEMGH